MKKTLNLRPQRIAEVKQAASRDILDQYPYWKQHNMEMAAISLVNKKVEAILTHLSLDPLTAEEKALEVALVTIAASIQQRRALSDQQEADVAAGVAVTL